MMMRRLETMLVLGAALAASGCAYDGYGDGVADYRYDGADYGSLAESGLDPWLEETEEGRAILMDGFTGESGGIVDEEVADRANIWFRRYADTDADMRLTDEEIRVALVQAARDQGR
jgi:hypothetical protein